MIFSPNKRPKHRQIESGYVFDEGTVDAENMVCPKCGQRGNIFLISSGNIIYPGERYDTYRCETPKGYRTICGQQIYVRCASPEISWVSPNGKWVIYDKRDHGYGRWKAVLVVGNDSHSTYNIYWVGEPGHYCMEYDRPLPEYVEDAVFRIMKEIWADAQRD